MKNYSVLMSVYYKDNPDYLREAMKSIYDQTLPTNDFVLVCDGPLNDELDSVIEEMQKLFGNILNVYRLKKNSGLGNALNAGLKECKNELIGRMDSDDICRKSRFEKQINLFENNVNISFASGAINEFDIAPVNSLGVRLLPRDNAHIRQFSKKRNPMNHVAVMFKKSAVINSGGYKETFHLFEDYYLWIRMFSKGYEAANMEDVLVDVRTPLDMYSRRGGASYAKTMLKFHQWLKKIGWTNNWIYLTGAIPHAIVCILPNKMRKAVYKGLRK